MTAVLIFHVLTAFGTLEFYLSLLNYTTKQLLRLLARSNFSTVELRLVPVSTSFSWIILYVATPLFRLEYFTMVPSRRSMLCLHYYFFLYNKTNRRTHFQIYSGTNSTCFGQFLCPSSGVFYRTFSTGTCYTGLMTASVQDQDGTAVPSLAVGRPVQHVPVPNVR